MQNQTSFHLVSYNVSFFTVFYLAFSIKTLQTQLKFHGTTKKNADFYERFQLTFTETFRSSDVRCEVQISYANFTHWFENFNMNF